MPELRHGDEVRDKAACARPHIGCLNNLSFGLCPWGRAAASRGFSI